MPSTALDDRSSVVSAALLKLDRTVEQIAAFVERTDEMLTGWERRWHRQQQRIAERLRVIDAQLAGAEPTRPKTVSATYTNASPPPEFGIVGVPADASEMASMAW